MDPVIARKTWRTLEPIHGMVYFAPEAEERYRALGINGRAGYFASRVAAMGPVSAEMVIATFFNFCPDLIRRHVPSVWAIADPGKVLAARYDAVDAALRRALGDLMGTSGVSEAATLARRAAEAAQAAPQGRPLFAAHAALEWPEEPHLVLWHAQTLLREFRGDGHIAALLVEGLSGVEALVIHAATGDVPAAVLQASRAWPDDEWAAAIERLQSRGLLTPGADLSLTDAGRHHRQWVEDRTDALSMQAYGVLGEDGCAELRSAGRPLSKAIIEAGLLPVNPSRFLSED